MGWNQRNSRFYMEVRSARQNMERILGDANSGLNAVMAGEKGSIVVDLWAGRNGTDRFQVKFKPWRSCENTDGVIQLAEGILDFDVLRAESKGTVQVVVDKDLREAIAFMRAKQVMLDAPS